MRWFIQRLCIETDCWIRKFILCFLIPELVCRDDKLVYFVTIVVDSGFYGDGFGPVTAAFNLRLGFNGKWIFAVGSRINLSLGFWRMVVFTVDIITDKGKTTCCKYRRCLTFYLLNTNFFCIQVHVLETVLLTVVWRLRFRLPVCTNLFLGYQNWFYIRVQIHRVNINMHQKNSIIWIPLNTWRIPTSIA